MPGHETEHAQVIGVFDTEEAANTHKETLSEGERNWFTQCGWFEVSEHGLNAP